MSASFAGLLGFAHAAAESAELAIQGDARYYERCVRDHCFDRVRTQLDSLLARLSTIQEGETNSLTVELQQALQSMCQMAGAEAIVQKYSAQAQQIDALRKQGHYVALRTAATRALENLGACLKDGIASLEQTAKDATAELARVHSQLTREAERIEGRLASTKRERDNSPSGRGIGYLIVGVICLALSVPNLPSFFSIVGLLFGGLATVAASAS